MSVIVHPQAQPIIDAFIANGAKSFEKMGEIPELRAVYETNCGLAAMKGLEHIETQDLSAELSGEPIHLRIYDTQMQVTELRPTVIFIHGGGWVIGNLNTHDSICRKIANVAQVRVIAVDYRLAPEYKFPVQYQDCERALQYILENDQQLKVNRQRLVFCGDSAGANLAGYLGQNFYQKYGTALKAQVLLYPVIGFVPESMSYQTYQSGFPLVNSTMHWFFDQLANEQADKEAISLLSQPFDSNNGDIYLLTLEHDPLRDEAILYLEKAIQSGLNVEYHHLKGLMHGIFTIAGKLAVAEEYLNHIGKYIAAKI
ncbi:MULTISPECIES: alpha/beta hydrolase [unclassified Acinetobacter]|uniref:alpha/beta hydrolase n=1 Tax=Acinetobacter TaxID=469 RepID=UPI000538DAA1|nr:alpha/beta hydrolase [Acinetobacter sp. HR7]KGT47035.1 alpha/beta hydrolase [Acinetobacter sp. HR7]